VLGTYASALFVVGASLVIGQAALMVCGWRRWSWLAPAVGVAMLLAVTWATVRLPGEGRAALGAVGLLLAAAALVLWRQPPVGVRRALPEGLPAAILVLAGVSIPFVVEGHFGVLGTTFNPDMGQQLFAADWLADSDRPEPTLLQNGYPLGPHALAAALSTFTGDNLVQALSGLTIAVPLLAALTSLAVLRELPAVRRAAAAALVGLPYMVASYLAQGLFKELLMALFVLGFALCLHELARREPATDAPAGPLAAVPLGLIAIGAVYAYSAPGLAWLVATAALFALAELWRGRRSGRDVAALGKTALAPVGIALAVFVVAVAPEIGRMIEFRGTAVDVAQAESPDDGAGETAGGEAAETPAAEEKSGRRTADGEKALGKGWTGYGRADPEPVKFNNRLGNLVDQISPLEALGIWPSGDFRLEPGDGAVPAPLFYLGALLGALALGVGLMRWWSRGEPAVPAALAAAVAVYLAARIASTPYTSAKAVLMIAPLATLVPVRELLAPAARTAPARVIRPVLAWALGAAFVLAAGASSLLALANAPVGPRDYSDGLTLLRSAVIDERVLVLAPQGQLDEEHAEEFIAWELRGTDFEIRPGGGETRSGRPPAGVVFVITSHAGPNPPYRRAVLEKRVKPYRLWRVAPD
jgi:hypothetical protein